jgi:tetratricopeptide (TPR) repeat protein
VLRGRVEQAWRDLEVVATLEEVRLRQAQVKEGGFDWRSADEGYAEAFRAYGIDVEALSEEEAAKRVRGSGAREELTAALDHWAQVRASKKDRKGAGRLWAVAGGADDDAWRARLRAALVGRDAKALRALAREAEAGRQPAVVVCLLARGLREVGAAEAEKVMRAGVGRRPSDFWLCHDLAFLLGRGKRFGEAEGYYRAALAVRPESPGVWLNLGICLCDQKKLDEAAVCYRRALEIEPGFAAAHNNLGNALKAKGQADEAIACYRKAIELDPKYAMPHYNLGNALKDKGQVDEAIACYQKAIALDPRYAAAHTNLGNALQGKGQVDEAIACFQKAIALDPKDAIAHYNLGVALQGKGQVDEAIACFRKAIALDPRYAPAHTNLGNALRDKGQVDEAIECYQKAIEIDPKFAQAHYNLGNALYGKGKEDEAIACYHNVVRLDPRNAQAHYNLGNALAGKGQVDGAIACYRQVLSLDPRYAANVRGALGQALLRKGRFAEARDACSRALQLLPANHPLRIHVSRQLRTSERLLKLEGWLPGLLRGADRPGSSSECLDLASMCRQHKRLHAAAARFYAEAFARGPGLADDLAGQHRYRAACSAALAAAGQGQDAGGLRRMDRLALRRQALTWLRAELRARRQQLKSALPDEAARARAALAHWQRDADLAGLRDGEALKALSADERQACLRLWVDVATALPEVGVK